MRKTLQLTAVLTPIISAEGRERLATNPVTICVKADSTEDVNGRVAKIAEFCTVI